MDVPHFIAEVKARPALWDIQNIEYRDRTNVPQLWQQVADAVGFDVEHCKRKWKNLRDAFRAEIRRTQRRAEIYKDLDEDDPRRNRLSKWIYFKPMSFIFAARRPRRKSILDLNEYSTRNSSDEGGTSNDHTEHEQSTGDYTSLHTEYDIKSEPANTTDDDDMDDDYLHDGMVEDDEEEDENDILFKQFQTAATPQAVERLQHSINAAAEQAQSQNKSATVALPNFGNNNTPPVKNKPSTSLKQQPVCHKAPSPPPIAATAAVTTSAAVNCKCSSRVDQQVHFLQDLEREEEKLMKSTRQDITRCDTMSHVGDSDYNFLISFLPLMKKMSEMQNIHFRAKMSELLLYTMANNQETASSFYIGGAPTSQLYVPPPMPPLQPKPQTQRDTQPQQLFQNNASASTSDDSPKQMQLPIVPTPEQTNGANNAPTSTNLI